jgi:hypothetical protein
MMPPSKGSDDDISEDEDVHVPDFTALAGNIQNWVSRHAGSAMTEAQHFDKFFGTRVLIVKKLWELVERDSLLPK